MTLKEKFDALIPIEFGGMQEPLLSNCEQIADKFAIGFGRWLENLTEEFYETTKAETYEELLEIYKKEKEL